MAVPLLSAKQIEKVYGSSKVLKGVNLLLYGGEVHSIVGENGAGKSTLAKVLAGVVVPSSGQIELDNQVIHLAGPRQALEKGIALIHQEPLTFPNLTVAENVFVGNQPGGLRIDWKSMETRAAELFEELGLNLNPRSLAGSLPIASQQMIELANALAHEAKVIICDETTASLTPKEVDELFVILNRLKNRGKAIAFVSHRLQEVTQISDQITILRDGEKVGQLQRDAATVSGIIRLMVGREVETSFRSDRERVPSTPMLKVREITRPGKFENISFEVNAGEILGLAGLVGAGRTEVCESIFGAHPVSQGTIEFRGVLLKIWKPSDAIRIGIGMVPEDRQRDGLHTSFNIRENAVMVVLSNLSKRGWLKIASERLAAILAIKETLVVCEGPEQPISELSGGNQQKIVISKWLAMKPGLLILDEPTRGVDIGAKESIHRLIRKLVDEEGMSVLMVSSDLNEVLALSDRIIVMREGKMAQELSGDEATADGVMYAATGQVLHQA